MGGLPHVTRREKKRFWALFRPEIIFKDFRAKKLPILGSFWVILRPDLRSHMHLELPCTPCTVQPFQTPINSSRCFSSPLPLSGTSEPAETCAQTALVCRHLAITSTSDEHLSAIRASSHPHPLRVPYRFVKSHLCSHRLAYALSYPHWPQHAA